MGSVELLILAMFIVPVVLGVSAAVSASKLPDAAFERAGTSKTLWIVLPIVGVFVCGLVAIVASIIWFSSTKPKVVAASAGAV
jgi:hypothetical protein